MKMCGVLGVWNMVVETTDLGCHFALQHMLFVLCMCLFCTSCVSIMWFSTQFNIEGSMPSPFVGLHVFLPDYHKHCTCSYLLISNTVKLNDKCYIQRYREHHCMISDLSVDPGSAELCA